MGTILDVHGECEKENEYWIDIEQNTRSLKSCLRKFGFVRLLPDLDDNLEAVRRHKISEDEHKKMIKMFDKKMLKLSAANHPDFTDNKTEAHNNQTTINAIRILIIRLSENFLREIDIDYRYEYYAYTDINSIGNEEDVDKLNLNLHYSLIKLSEIKHENIIANIKNFLRACEESLDCYYEWDCKNFLLNFNLALNRLKDCISGYRALTRELNNIEKECGKDHKLKNTLWTVKRLSVDFERQLNILEKIKDVAEQSLKGTFQVYAEYEILDTYFVLPFAKYINILSMCNVMFGNSERSWFSKNNCIKNFDFYQLDWDDKERKFHKAYILALYVDNPNSANENTVYSIFKNTFHGNNLMSCKYNFDSILENIIEELKKDFNVEKHYIVRSVRNRTEEYSKEVPDFEEVMLECTKSDMLGSVEGQGKSRTDEKDNDTLLTYKITDKKELSEFYPRIETSNEDFKKGTRVEEDLTKKIKDNFKEIGETLKTKILQSEITNERLRDALGTYKKEESVLLKELVKFSSKSSVKLIDEILERVEDNRKLLDEIQMKREEELLLMLTLRGKYEEINSLLGEKINEIEKEVLDRDIKTSENAKIETDRREGKYEIGEDMNRMKSFRDGENQNSMFQMDRKKDMDIKYYTQSIEHQTSLTLLENKNIGFISKFSTEAALRKLGTDKNCTKTVNNERKNEMTAKDRLLFKPTLLFFAIKAFGGDNVDLNQVENYVQNSKLGKDSLKENENFKISEN